MTAQTYKYVKVVETTLRPEYGGATILSHADSQEVGRTDLLLRALMVELGLPANGIDQLCQIGDDGVDTWLKISDNLYPAISPHLTTAELATVVSSAPAGYSDNSGAASHLPKWNKIAFITISDSIGAGIGTPAGNYTDTYIYKGLQTIAGYEDLFSYINMAMGSRSFNNVDGTINPNTGYPENFSTAYVQRLKTQVFNAPGMRAIFYVCLGSNDFAYGTSVTGEIVFGRAIDLIGKIRTDFPNAVIILGTIMKRSGNLNYGESYNTLIRADYKKMGADLVFDFKEEMGDATLANDGVHPDATEHAVPAPAFGEIVEDAMALLPHTPDLYAPEVVTAAYSTGTLNQGDTLTCNPSVCLGIPVAGRAYQWYDYDGDPISGADSISYVLQASDVHPTLSPTCIETITNSEGEVTSQTVSLGAVIAGLTVPDAIDDFANTATADTTADFSFTAPDNGGAAITDYEFRYRVGDSGGYTTFSDGVGTDLTVQITGLTAATGYEAQARPVNSEGAGDWSNTATFTTAAASGDFTSDANTYHYDFRASATGNTLDVTGTESMETALEQLAGVINLTQATKADQPLTNTDGVDFGNNTTRELNAVSVAGINAAATKFYMGGNFYWNSTENGMLFVDSSPNIEIYLTSSRRVGIKLNGSWLGYTGQLSLSAWHSIEILINTEDNELTVWVDGAVASLAYNNAAAGLSTFGAVTAIKVGDVGASQSHDGLIQQLVLQFGAATTAAIQSISDHLTGDIP